MNERIKDLKEQALIWSVETLDPDALNDNEWGVAIDKKFAELIIEECAKVVEKNLYQNIGWNTARKVKEHFGIGVEE